MDALHRYINLFKNSKYGFNLPKGSLLNYIKIRAGIANDKIGALGKTYPAIMSLAVSKRCNLQCSFCAFGSLPDNWKENELTVEKFEKLLNADILKKTIGIVFTGGEPLLNKDLPNLIQMAYKGRHIVGMVSNGLLFDSAIAKELRRFGLFDMQISVYDWTKDKLSSVLPIVSRHIPIFASYVLTKQKLTESLKNNFSDIIDIIRMCKESGCQSLKFSLCTYQIGEDISNTIMDTDEIYSQFIETCKRALSNICFKGYKCGLSFPTNKFACLFPIPVSLNPKKRICRIPWNLYCDVNGNYAICCRLMPDLNQKGCANIFKDLESAVNSQRARTIRERLLNKSFPIAKECFACAYMNSYSQV
jgi:organic radical activating enzyme